MKYVLLLLGTFAFVGGLRADTVQINEQKSLVPANIAEICCACAVDLSPLETEIDQNSTMIEMLKTSTGQLPSILQGTGFMLAGVVAGETDVTFTVPFASAPYVVAVLNSSSSFGAPAAVDSVTTTGFTIKTYTGTSVPHSRAAQQVYFWVIQ